MSSNFFKHKDPQDEVLLKTIHAVQAQIDSGKEVLVERSFKEYLNDPDDDLKPRPGKM